jgi:hypothetical protein
MAPHQIATMHKSSDQSGRQLHNNMIKNGVVEALANKTYVWKPVADWYGIVPS